MSAPAWYLYVVRTNAGHLYTGIATDVDRRFEEHAAGDGRGAKALRGKGPLELVYRLKVGDRGLALQLEHRLKRCTREQKEDIVSRAPSKRTLVRTLVPKDE